MVFSKIITHPPHDEGMLLEEFRENIGIDQNGESCFVGKMFPWGPATGTSQSE